MILCLKVAGRLGTSKPSAVGSSSSPEVIKKRCISSRQMDWPNILSSLILDMFFSLRNIFVGLYALQQLNTLHGGPP